MITNVLSTLFNNLEINKKLPLTILLFGLIPALIISGYFLYTNSEARKIEGPQNLQRTTDTTLVDMEHYLLTLKDKLIEKAQTVEVVEGLKVFNQNLVFHNPQVT